MDDDAAGKIALGQRIKYVREEILGIEQDDLAKALGVTRGAVGNWELGGGAKFSNLQKLANLSKISIDWIARGVGSSVPEDGADSMDDDPPRRPSTVNHRAYSREHYKPKVEGALPEVDVSLGAGDGRVGEVLALGIGGESYSGHKVVNEWLLPLSFVGTETRASYINTVVMAVVGDSMQPEFNIGDRVLVDLSQNLLVQDGVYAISDGQSEPRIKRLQYILNSKPKRIRVSSDNPRYAPEEHLLSDIHIVGRVCGVIARR